MGIINPTNITGGGTTLWGTPMILRNPPMILRLHRSSREQQTPGGHQRQDHNHGGVPVADDGQTHHQTGALFGKKPRENVGDIEI